jgi:peptidoglycan/xylan/chitin deacetylase (PgdA/CDA1 family)
LLPTRGLKRLPATVMLRSSYYAALHAVGLPALTRRLRDAGVILCYHNVSPTRAPPSGDAGVHLSPEKFATQVAWLARHYDVVPLRELLDRLAKHRSLRGLAAITFDDGYMGVFEHAWPLLLELGLPATVFVVADAPETGDPFWWDHPAAAHDATPERREHWLKDLRGDGEGIISDLSAVAAPSIPRALRPADWDTIGRATDAGLTLGVHSATHRTLTELDDVELEREVVASWETIRRRVGGRPEIFAYPYGRWNAQARDAVRAAGYGGAVTLDYGLVRPNADPWTLPRVNIPASISQSAFQAWAAGLAPRRSRA